MVIVFIPRICILFLITDIGIDLSDHSKEEIDNAATKSSTELVMTNANTPSLSDPLSYSLHSGNSKENAVMVESDDDIIDSIDSYREASEISTSGGAMMPDVDDLCAETGATNTTIESAEPPVHVPISDEDIPMVKEADNEISTAIDANLNGITANGFDDFVFPTNIDNPSMDLPEPMLDSNTSFGLTESSKMITDSSYQAVATSPSLNLGKSALGAPKPVSRSLEPPKPKIDLVKAYRDRMILAYTKNPLAATVIGGPVPQNGSLPLDDEDIVRFENEEAQKR